MNAQGSHSMGVTLHGCRDVCRERAPTHNERDIHLGRLKEGFVGQPRAFRRRELPNQTRLCLLWKELRMSPAFSESRQGTAFHVSRGRQFHRTDRSWRNSCKESLRSKARQECEERAWKSAPVSRRTLALHKSQRETRHS